MVAGTQMWVNRNPQAYRDLAQRHLTGLEPI
ncbi:carnitine operon protein CaiE [Mycobacterium haemophilum DSM 44634]